MFRPITINAVLNGWIVTVGCQTVVYQDRNQLTSDLDAYLKDPEATEARFLKTAVNQAHTLGGAPATAAPTATLNEAAMPSRGEGAPPLGLGRQRDEAFRDPAVARDR
jgi:hypothetical protein